MAWFMEYPWLTFWMVFFTLVTIDNIFENYFRYKLAKREKELLAKREKTNG